MITEDHMPYQDFQENWEQLLKLITQSPQVQDERMNVLIKRCVEQNLTILNDIVAASIDHLKKLEKAKSANDVICTQAKFAADINTKLSKATQRFLNASLGDIADYNEWLKSHCDLATD